MSFPRYPEYKPSCAEWLGEIPEHWGAAALRWLSRRYSGGTPDRDNPAYWVGGVVPWLNSGAVNDRFIREPSATITDAGLAESSAKWIPRGALVMALAGQGRTKGMVAQLDFDSTCNQSMAAIIPGTGLSARFLFWWLDSNYQNIRNMAGGDLRDGLNLDLLGNIPCPLPPLPEQRAIAAFLDRETAKIDGLVAEQQRLIELLKEKRQAVISHAVTKGLDPKAPMKPSGVEWLGDVPEHWEVHKLGRLGRFRAGAGFPDTHQGQLGLPIPFFKVGDLNRADSRGAMVEAQHTITADTAATLRAAIFPPSAIVFAKVGAALLLQRFRWLDRPACIDNNMMGFELSPAADLRFTLYRLPLIDLSRIANPGAVPSINEGQLSELRLALPPLPEQRAIAAFLDSETAKIDGLIAEAESAITLLQERRSALISAAVTGQIDVRNVVATEVA